MKKNKLFTTVFALLSLAIFSFVFSCTPTGEYKLEGVPTEIVLKASDSKDSFDFLEGVTATLDGKAVDINVDLSQVEFGKGGSYEVTYKVGTEERKVPVKIYEMPTAEVTDLTVAYKDVKTKLGTNIKVTDTFGVELELTLDESELIPNGFYQSGTLKFSATDSAGNVYNGTQNVTVELPEPTELEKVEVDLSNVAVQIPLSEKLLAATIDGQVIPKQHVVQSGNNVVITGNYINELGVGDYEVLFYTEVSVAKADLIITDTELPNFVVDTETNKEGINNYIFVKGDELVLPTPKLAKNSYQNLTFESKLFLNGVEIPLENFDNNQTGKYKLEVTATKANDETKVKTITQEFYIVVRDAKIVYFDPVISNQTAQVWTTVTEVGSKLSRVVETFSGENRYAMKYENNSVELDSTRSLYLNKQVIEDALNSGIRTLTFDVMFTEIPEGVEASVTLMSTGEGYWVATRGTVINEVNKWHTISFNLDSDFIAGHAELQGDTRVYVEDAYGDYKLRFEDFEILTSYTYKNTNDEYKTMPHVAYFSNFRFGASNIVARFAGTYMTADQSKTAVISNSSEAPLRLIDATESVTYSHVMVYENGLVIASLDNPNLTFQDEIIGTVSNFWFDIDGERYYKQLDSLDFSILVEKDYAIEELLNISKLEGSITIDLVEGTEYAQFMDNTLVGLVAGQEIVLRLTYEPGVYVDINVSILDEEAFYDRPFDSPEFEKYFLTTFAGNYVEYDASEEAMKLAQRSPSPDDSRGFFLDPDYLLTMRQLGYNYLTFKVKHTRLSPQDGTRINISLYQHGDDPEYLYQGSRWNWRDADFSTFTEDIYIDVTYDLVAMKNQFNGNLTSIIFLKESVGDIWIKDLRFTKTFDPTDQNNWFSTTQGTIDYDAQEDKFTVKGTGEDMHFFLSKDVVQYYLNEGANTLSFKVQNSNWQGNSETWKGFQIIGKYEEDGEIKDKWGYVNVMPVTSEIVEVKVDLLDPGNIWTMDVNFYTNCCQTTDLYIYDMKFYRDIDPTNKATWFHSEQGTISYDAEEDKFTVKGTKGNDMHFFLSKDVVQYYLSEGYTTLTFIVQNSNWQGNSETWKGFQIIGKELVDGVVHDKWGYVNETPATSELKEVTLNLLDPGNIWTIDVNFYTDRCETTDLYILDMKFNKPEEPPVDYTDKNNWFTTEQGSVEYDATEDKFTASGTGNDMHFFLSAEVIQYYLSQGYTKLTFKLQNSNWKNTTETFKGFQIVGRYEENGEILEKWAYIYFQVITSEITEVVVDITDPNNIWTMDLNFYTDKCPDTDLYIFDMKFEKPVDYTDKTTWFKTTQGTVEYDAEEDKFTVIGTGADIHFFLKTEVVQHYISEGYTTLTFKVQNSNWQDTPETYKNFQLIGKYEDNGQIHDKWGYVLLNVVTSVVEEVTIDLTDEGNIWTLDLEFYTNKCPDTNLYIFDMEFVQPAV